MKLNVGFNLLLRAVVISSISFFLSFSVAAAADDVAKVQIIKGSVTAINADGSTEKLKRGAWVKEGAKIQTADKSFVKFLFKDKSQMNLGPKSEMVIEKFPKKKAGIISLMKGSLRSKVTKNYLEKNSGKSKLFIKTKTAAMGVRGTDFNVSFNPASQVTNLDVVSGAVAMAKINPSDFSNNDHSALEGKVSSPQAVMVKKEQTSNVSPNANRAAPPKKMPKEKLEALKKNDGAVADSKKEEKKKKTAEKKQKKKEAKEKKKAERKKKVAERKQKRKEAKEKKKAEKKQKTAERKQKRQEKKQAKQEKRQQKAEQKKTAKQEPKQAPKEAPKKQASTETKTETKQAPKESPKTASSPSTAKPGAPAPNAKAPKGAPAPGAPTPGPTTQAANAPVIEQRGPQASGVLAGAPPTPGIGPGPTDPIPTQAAPPPVDMSAMMPGIKVGDKEIDASSVMGGNMFQNTGGGVEPPPQDATASAGSGPTAIAPPPQQIVFKGAPSGGDTSRAPASEGTANGPAGPANGPGPDGGDDKKVEDPNNPPPPIAGLPPVQQDFDVYEVLNDADNTEIAEVADTAAEESQDAVDDIVEDAATAASTTTATICFQYNGSSCN